MSTAVMLLNHGPSFLSGWAHEAKSVFTSPSTLVNGGKLVLTFVTLNVICNSVPVPDDGVGSDSFVDTA